jgi:DNA-binding transcriptional ArsR family regulator
VPGLNLTPTRLKILALLRDKGEFYVSGLAEEVAPRGYIGAHRVTWSCQGAARWGGGAIKPLETAGLVKVNRFVSGGVGMASLTEAGRRALAAAEQAGTTCQQGAVPGMGRAQPLT